MKGSARTKEEKHELFEVIEPFLQEGVSLRKSCEITGIPYTTMRDIVKSDEVLRVKMHIAQRYLIDLAIDTVRKSLKEGNIKTAIWFLDRAKNIEPLVDVYEGGIKEQEDRGNSAVSVATSPARV